MVAEYVTVRHDVHWIAWALCHTPPTSFTRNEPPSLFPIALQSPALVQDMSETCEILDGEVEFVPGGWTAAPQPSLFEGDDGPAAEAGVATAASIEKESTTAARAAEQ